MTDNGTIPTRNNTQTNVSQGVSVARTAHLLIYREHTLRAHVARGTKSSRTLIASTPGVPLDEDQQDRKSLKGNRVEAAISCPENVEHLCRYFHLRVSFV